MDRWHWGQASLPMTIREECFPGTAFAGCTGYPFPTLSFRAQREIFFVTPFASSFAKPFIGSTAHRLSAIRCFPFLAVGRAPSYRQRKRSLGFARDDDTGIALSQHILYTMRRISPYDPQKKSPSQSWSFFCVRKTYLPNCASMVPAATAVPITPATFGPIACISR